MTSISYVSTPARLLNYILTGDPSGLDSRDIDTCNKWFSPEVLGVILDVQTGPRVNKRDEAMVCLVCGVSSDD
jgi:hypothetical protein